MTKYRKDIDTEQVEKLASRGLTVDQIAYCCGVSPATFYNRQKTELDLLDAVKKGRASGIEQISNKLFEAANNGNITAQIFYLKNRDPERWQDRRDFTVETKAPRTVEQLSMDELVALDSDGQPKGNGKDASP